MRARNIKPGFFKNEELAQCSFQARLLFAGLWCLADREGRLEKRPLRIKAEVFPYDNVDVNGELTVLERMGFIQTYVVAGKEYLAIVNFLDHQRPHHTEAESKLPCIQSDSQITVNSPLSNGEYPPDSLIPDSLIPDSLILTRSKGNEIKTEEEDILERVIAYTNSPHSRAYYQGMIRKIGPDLVWEAVGEVKMREAEGSVDNRAKYLTALLEDWAKERA